MWFAQVYLMRLVDIKAFIIIFDTFFGFNKPNGLLLSFYLVAVQVTLHCDAIFPEAFNNYEAGCVSRVTQLPMYFILFFFF